MKKIFYLFMTSTLLFAASCSSDDDNQNDQDPANSVFTLESRSDASIFGDVTFTDNENGSTTVVIDLNGTTTGSHPAHIHENSAVEGGDIIVSLEPVDASTGLSTTVVSTLNDGTAISYEQLIELDAYVNVHQSADDLGTLIAQGDIGVNVLTGEVKEYVLNSKAVPTISGVATFSKRVSGAALVEIQLDGTPNDGQHPAHIHFNTAAESGAIAKSLTTVDGTTGYSATHIEELNDETQIGYDGLLEFDGYINVHLSAAEIGTIVAQGDIGQNELTGEVKEYALGSRAIPSISGIATFSKRVSGAALVEIQLQGTPDNGEHPAHIHFNTAAESGAIAKSLNTVDGTTGYSATNIEALNDETSIDYEALLDFDGYINVHLSAAELGTIVAQGDIGQNELTGNSVDYDLAAVSDATIFGTANFAERVNGETLVTVNLVGTTAGNLHPAHIHSGDVANAPGAIIVSLGNVVGETGVSLTNVTQLSDGSSIDYTAMTAIDGYINVHLSADDLATLVAQGNVGANAG
ncbi:CHRD domain-containing protein [Dokdonia sp. Hel_I_53]|uniref:CHRD domain-containing protein n=1 Tax=Dokdonia sp. Hel_I_53 TaxID=1566287 RepID=UPI00119BAEBC|nr:CHRD domain-containing protein [Dokdonia sp. Hel_I_53]TVZ51514.1 hypothetical protein OD90_0657 [Dokdonia sp. Hel_I_53]